MEYNIIVYNGFGAGAISCLSVHYCAETKYARRKRMIDEELTFEKYGYYSTDWKPKSRKRVVAVCDGCGAIRYPKKQAYRELCGSCAQKKKPLPSDKTKHNISVATKGKKKPPLTDEHRQRLSAAGQGIPYEEWDGFVSNGEYCEKFDEACRERIREKYDRKCFLCNKNEIDNKQKLCVHHFDMNKDAGCNGNLWKLVPLCRRCHCKAHSKIWTTRIEYLLDYAWSV